MSPVSTRRVLDFNGALLGRILRTNRGDISVQHNSDRDPVIRTTFTRGFHESYLRDWTYGATNGAVTTFVIVAAVVGADLPPTVALVLGLVNLFANGLAAAARRYIGTKHSPDHYMRLPTQAALNTFGAFILCGLVPLVSYLLVPTRLSVCVVAAACILFVIGTVKSRSSSTARWVSGLNTVLLGLCAGALAYAVARTLSLLINIPRL